MPLERAQRLSHEAPPPQYAWQTVSRDNKKKPYQVRGRIPGYREQPGIFNIRFEKPDKKECCPNAYKCYDGCGLYHTPRQRDCFRDPYWPVPTPENRREFEQRGVDPFPFLSDEQITTMTNIARSMEARIPMWLHPNDKKDYHNNVYVGQKANAPAGSKRKRQDARNLSPDAQQRMIDERVAIGIRAARDYEAAEASRRAEAEERAQRAEIDRLVPRSQRNTVTTDLTPEERQLIQERRRAESSALTSHVMSSVDPTWSEPVAQVRPKPSAQELNAKKRADAKAAEKAPKPKKKNDDDDEDQVDFEISD